MKQIEAFEIAMNPHETIKEFLKENQSDFEAGMALNMGQLLSIPFVIIGVIFFIRALRSKEKAESQTAKKRTTE